MEEDIVQKTTGENPPPEESTHWTSRLMGKALGIDHVSIWRVWRKYGLKPHQSRRFKLSRDPRLVEDDVVGVSVRPRQLLSNPASHSGQHDARAGLRPRP